MIRVGEHRQLQHLAFPQGETIQPVFPIFLNDNRLPLAHRRFGENVRGRPGDLLQPLHFSGGCFGAFLISGQLLLVRRHQPLDFLFVDQRDQVRGCPFGSQPGKANRVLSKIPYRA